MTAIANVSLTNTFDEWRTITNQLVFLANEVEANGNLVRVQSNTSAITVTANIGRGDIIHVNANVSYNIADQSRANLASANVVNAVYNVLTVAFAQANAANVLAFNSAAGANAWTNTVYGLSNSYAQLVGAASNLVAGQAFNRANTANITADLAFNKANDANVLAFNSAAGANAWTNTIYGFTNTYTRTVGAASNLVAGQAFNRANTANITADLAFDKANAANLLAFNSAAGANAWTNTVYGLSNSYTQAVGSASNVMLSAAFFQANQAFFAANSAAANITTLIASSFGQANIALAKANTANITADLAFNRANTANIIASGAFDKANTANVLAFNALPNTTGTVFNNQLHVPTLLAGNSNSGLARLRLIESGNVTYVQAGTDVSSSSRPIRFANYLTTDTTMTVDLPNSSVGIGTTSPTSNLHVVGTALVSTALTIGVINVAPTIGAAFNKANAANVLAETANTRAESAHTRIDTLVLTSNSNTAIVTDIAGSGYAKANSANIVASGAFDKANAANVLAFNSAAGANAWVNTVYGLSNTYAQSVGNASNLVAGQAFNRANTANITADLAFNKANAANVLAFNSAAGANAWTNTIYGLSNTFTHTIGGAGFFQANQAFALANAANVLAFNSAAGANAWANVIGVNANAYANVIGTRSNNYALSIVGPAFDKANAANVLAFNSAAGANAWANVIGVNANAYANIVGERSNNFSLLLGTQFTPINTYVLLTGTAVNAYANVIGTRSNNYTLSIVGPAFDKANAANVLAFNALSNTTGTVFNGILNLSETRIGNTSAGMARLRLVESANLNYIQSGTDIAGTGRPILFTKVFSGATTLALDIANGYVGINTTVPAVALDINGTSTESFIGTGSVSGNVLTVTAVTSGTLSVGDYITIDTNELKFGIYIRTFSTGSGGIGNYFLSESGTASGTIRATNLKDKTIRITKSDTVIQTNEPVGMIQFYSTDSSFDSKEETRAFIVAQAKDTSGSVDLVMGTAYFPNSATEKLRLTYDGRLGIGTSTPSSEFHVVGNAFISSALSIGTINVAPTIGAAFNKANDANVLAFNSAAGANAWANVIGVNANAYANVIGTRSNGYALLVAGGAFFQANQAFAKANSARTVISDSLNATRYIIFANGTSGTASSLNVNSTFTFNPSTGTVSASNFNSTSDINLKYDIEKIENALDIINSIDGIRFKWKSTNKKSIGVSAQNIEMYLPELVAETDGIKAVNYDGIIGILIESIKQLKKEIDELKNS
jgi:hypothetical protein